MYGIKLSLYSWQLMQVAASLGDQQYGGFSIPISPFQQPRKQMRATHVWKIMSTITLWILWKYRFKRRHESIIPLLSDILPEFWGSLLALVLGQYNNMPGSSEVVLKKRKKIIAIMEEVAFVHSLFSRTVMEISSPMVLALTISFVYNTLCFCQCFS